jgi:pimeloyl-ACP methyl ester carboxylesterase
MINKPIAAIAAAFSLFSALLVYDTQGFVRVRANSIDANGPNLRMRVLGSGRPAVVFENGGGGSLELWGQVPARVSEFAKVVAYDRAGDGLSDKVATQLDGRIIASQLHAALRNARIPPPYILVGHSLGGPYSRIFAGIYPKEVAGMVLVDPTQEEMMAWNDENGFSRASDRPQFLSATLGQVRESVVPPGIPVFLIHVMHPWPHGPFPSRDIDEMAARVMSRVPLRLKFHKEWIESIPGGRMIITDISSHGGINFEEPELVIDTIRNVVVEIRKREALP